MKLTQETEKVGQTRYPQNYNIYPKYLMSS